MTTYHPTGNEYIALPTVRESDGAIEGMNIVLEKADGLIDVEGDGAPFLACDAMATEPDAWKWHFLQHWIPCFEHTDGGRAGCVFAPPRQRFFVYRGPEGPRGARFTMNIGRIFQTINVRHELPDWVCRIQHFNWSHTPGVVIEIFAGTLLFTISLRSPGGADYRLHANGREHSLNAGTGPVETLSAFSIEVDCQGRADLVVGLGLSRVGARAADLETHRVPIKEWQRRTVEWLAERTIPVPGDNRLAAKANRNAHFARFYAMARTLDTSRVVSMTSRSHRYYVSAAYWDRDSLLWLYPFLLRNDREHARELLRYAFGPQLPHAGIHSRQINGQILEYGFELDELVAPLLAVGQWCALYPDDPAWREPQIAAGIRELLRRLKSWRVDGEALYRTELMPTDDLIVGGRDVLTYNNALVRQTLRMLIPILEETQPAEAEWARAEVDAIAKAIDHHLVRNGLYQWAADLKGSCEMYDEAAGSLLLLPYYGLCSADAATFRRTVEHLYSKAYPYCMPGPFSELGNRHTDGDPHPWILSACNSILSGVRVEQGLDLLRRAPMDNGIACESINVETGLPESGEHFATCAGFVAHAIAYGTGAYGLADATSEKESLSGAGG
ncbi:glycoside hydrolase family 125 protein [bacterium]|nr:glycoside hydrolase family 125 protein [bacterium]